MYSGLAHNITKPMWWVASCFCFDVDRSYNSTEVMHRVQEYKMLQRSITSFQGLFKKKGHWLRSQRCRRSSALERLRYLIKCSVADSKSHCKIVMRQKSFHWNVDAFWIGWKRVRIIFSLSELRVYGPRKLRARRRDESDGSGELTILSFLKRLTLPCKHSVWAMWDTRYKLRRR